jgi:hypothetical protein
MLSCLCNAKGYVLYDRILNCLQNVYLTVSSSISVAAYVSRSPISDATLQAQLAQKGMRKQWRVLRNHLCQKEALIF